VGERRQRCVGERGSGLLGDGLLGCVEEIVLPGGAGVGLAQDDRSDGECLGCLNDAAWKAGAAAEAGDGAGVEIGFVGEQRVAGVVGLW
jgi:hypothetical protein